MLAGLALIPAAGLAAWFAVRPRVSTAAQNVLLITIDTLRADHLGCYGDRRAATPVLDGLAARGVRFATAIVQAPLTAPSHASILTGRTPPRHGVRDNGTFVLPEDVPTLASAFRASGHETAAFVSGFPLERRYGLARGFDSYDDRFPHGDDPRAAYIERRADETTAAVLRWLARRSAKASGHWFLWVHYFDPHAPYEPPPESAARVAGRAYDGEIAFVDTEIGVLLRKLEETGELARTLVVATADHGESLGEHGELTHGVFVYDATLRVPLIVAGPGVSAGLVSPTVARGIDIAPTVSDLAGVPVAAGTEGRSLRDALSGLSMTDAPAYAEALFSRLQLGWAPLHAWRTARWKLVDAPRSELYALDSDPEEKVNRADQDPGMRAELLRPLRAAVAADRWAGRPAVDAGASERLAALGYLGGTEAVPLAASPRDPKDGVEMINRLERGIAEAHANPGSSARELAAILAEEPGFSLARRYRAIALAAARDFAGAVAELRILERDHPLPVNDLVLLGDYLRLSGHPDAAQSPLERAAGMDSRSPEPLLSLARTFVAQGRLDEAAATLERVLALVPDHPDALRGLGDVAFGREDMIAAERYYGLVLAADEQDAGALTKMGVIRVRQGRTDDGIELFRRAVAREPGSPEALLDLAAAFVKTGRPAEAAPYFDHTLAVARSQPALERNTLIGATRFLQGRFDESARAYQSALAVAPAPTPELVNGLAWAELKRGREAEAVAQFRRSLALSRNQPEVERLLAQVGSARRER
jgi:arylsulfatase A-like enzyme/tetratricopeptide (TPR) repeat protein